MTPEHRLLSGMSKEWDVLVLDLDGTLLCGQGEVSHSNLHALDMVRDLGTEVVVATGRSFSECKHILQWMNHHGVSITAGGSQLVTNTGETIERDTVEVDTPAIFAISFIVIPKQTPMIILSKRFDIIIRYIKFKQFIS